MDGIQIGCCVILLGLAILLDVFCGSYGYTLLCLSGIAVIGVILSYDYRKQWEESEARRKQYLKKLKR